MEEIKQKDIRCYVLVRNDLPSLNAGKAAAHTHHAGVQMVAKYFNNEMVKEYISVGIQQGADHFNTTIILSADLKQIDTAVNIAKKIGLVADLVVDPSYPFLIDKEITSFVSNDVIITSSIMNGQVLALRNEITCGYILGYADDPCFRSLIANFNLMN